MFKVKITYMVSFDVTKDGFVCNERYESKILVVSAAELEELRLRYTYVEILEELKGDASDQE